MSTTSSVGRDPTPAPSSTRPMPVKYRTSQAERLATASQAHARTNPRAAPRINTIQPVSHLGNKIDIRA